MRIVCITRFAVIIQIPIVIGAIVLVNTRQNIFTGNSELLFSIVILLLLFLFLVEGGGPLSLDEYFKKHPRDM